MQRRLKPIGLVLTLLLSGCAGLLFNQQTPIVFTKNNHQLDQRITHQVIWQDNNTTETFIAVLETHQQAIQLVGVSTAGISLFALDQTPMNQKLETSILFPSILNPQALLTYLQIFNGNTSEFNQALPAPWALTTKDQPYLLSYKQKAYATLLIDPQQKEVMLVTTTKSNVHITIKRLSVEEVK